MLGTCQPAAQYLLVSNAAQVNNNETHSTHFRSTMVPPQTQQTHRGATAECLIWQGAPETLCKQTGHYLEHHTGSVRSTCLCANALLQADLQARDGVRVIMLR